MRKIVLSVTLLAGVIFLAVLREWWYHPGATVGWLMGVTVLPVVDRWIIIALGIADLMLMGGAIWLLPAGLVTMAFTS